MLFRSLSPAQAEDILHSRQRSQAGANVPAHGLSFTGARYERFEASTT